MLRSGYPDVSHGAGTIRQGTLDLSPVRESKGVGTTQGGGATIPGREHSDEWHGTLRVPATTEDEGRCGKGGHEPSEGGAQGRPGRDDGGGHGPGNTRGVTPSRRRGKGREEEKQEEGQAERQEEKGSGGGKG